MDARTRARLEARCTVIKAMAHPTRLFIIEELSRQERCVGELTVMVGCDVSTVSKHLAVLRNAAILGQEKRGARVFYSLRVPSVRGVLNWADDLLQAEAREAANRCSQAS